MDKLILASGSPRRKQLLEQAGYAFSVVTADVDETNPPGMPGTKVPVFLAQKKADTVSAQYPGATVIAADTVVLLDNDILGKPEHEAAAKRMLQRLSGRKHLVVTGVCIQQDEQRHSFSCTTEVYFRELDMDTISYYVSQFHPFDKAGSYAIQEWIGLVGIEKINGDYYNVMGLPAGEVAKILGRPKY